MRPAPAPVADPPRGGPRTPASFLTSAPALPLVLLLADLPAPIRDDLAGRRHGFADPPVRLELVVALALPRHPSIMATEGVRGGSAPGQPRSWRMPRTDPRSAQAAGRLPAFARPDYDARLSGSGSATG